MSTFDFDKVKVINVNVDENDNKVNYIDDIHQLPIIEEPVKTKFQSPFKEGEKVEKEKKYHWAFFLTSMFIGIGLGEATDIHSFVLFGLAFGFLFFVDPIYQKVMGKINRW